MECSVRNGKTSAHRQARPLLMRHGDYGVRIPKFSRRQTVAKASSILVDQVEQRGYRRKIKAKLNGVGRDARQLRQAWRYSEAPYGEQCSQIGQCSL
jgi:hypothetical protein